MKSKLNLAGTINGSIVDGTGFRYTIFTQGCFHNCPECHNPATHDPLLGTEYDTKTILAEIKSNPMLSGITLSGGEPLLQATELLSLSRQVLDLNMDIWIYTGYTFEYIMSLPKDDDRRKLVEISQVLVDGPFQIENKDLTLDFRGSSNQRIIDLETTFKKNTISLLSLN